MLRAFLWGVVLTILAALGGGYAVLRSGLIPANADANPGPLEIWAAHTSLDATLTREAPKSPNPVPLTDANLIVGIDLPRTALQHEAVVVARGRLIGGAIAVRRTPRLIGRRLRGRDPRRVLPAR